MEHNLIVIRQLPIIEDQLRDVQARIQARVKEALDLVCTEETYKEVKKVRSELNKEAKELEARRKEVKAAILAPYEQFEAIYKECAGDIYAKADDMLKSRIAEVETGLRIQKEEEVRVYFEEYRQSLGLDADLANFEAADIKVGLSDSKKSLKATAKGFLDRIAGDLALIDTQDDKDEILVEYRKCLDVSKAVTAVSNRHKAMEQERQRREALAAERAERERVAAEVVQILEEEVAAPVPVTAPDPEIETMPVLEPERSYSTAFRVTASIDKLRALKHFLEEGGYTYEQL